MSTEVLAEPMDVDEYSGKKKPKASFFKEAQEVIAATRKQKIGDAIDALLLMEKKARLGNDPKSVLACAQTVLKICNDAPNYEQLSHNITLLCKRRGQFETVQTDLITFAAGLAKSDKFKGNDADREKVIATIRAVSEGKMKVEVTRAELTALLSRMKESEGKVEEASTLLQEEAVETFSTMSIQKKLEYLLEQLRLCLAVKDYIRANIIARKVDRNKLDRFEDLKVRFFKLLIEFYTHERDPLEIARAHLAIYNTPGYQSDENKWAPELQNAVILLAVSPYDPSQIDLVRIVLQDVKLKQMPKYKAFLTHFVTDELAQWPLPEHDVISKNKLLKEPKAGSTSDEDTWYYTMLRDRVIEHDIRVVAKYYTRINTERLGQMLQLERDETESYVASMVTNQTSQKLDARIDRPEGVISFELRKDPNDHLTEWTENISDLLDLAEKTCHLIHKENMIYQVGDSK